MVEDTKQKQEQQKEKIQITKNLTQHVKGLFEDFCQEEKINCME